MENSIRTTGTWLLVISVCGFLSQPAKSQNFGGGPPTPITDNCIPSATRERIEANVAKAMARLARSPRIPFNPPALYPFVPIAGNVWDDRFINNYVDLDSTSGILDWDCSDFTYDGHTGHDIDLRSFGEQDGGVPVFAALAGIVVDCHDGEFDRNTSMGNQPANYVVLFHGGTHYTWYYHLRNGSVAVTNNQVVKMGTQIGLAGSSGNSTAPHLHFESRNDDTYYEPSSGNCRSGTSGWVNQIPIRRDTWFEDFAIHNTNNFPAAAFLPYNPARTGTIIRTGTFQPIGAWFIIHNQAANDTFRARYLRPDGTVFFDSGTRTYNNDIAYRYSSWWLWFNLNPDTVGSWTLELSDNGNVMVQAPFLVLDPGNTPTNRPPNTVVARLDPAVPTTNDAVFCRLAVPLLADPDYDLMRYRYQWTINGLSVRDVTIAAHSDAIPQGIASAGDLIRCTATPFDGAAYGPPAVAENLVAGGTVMRLSIQLLSGNSQAVVSWPTSAVPYVLQMNTNLSTNGWVPALGSPVVVGAQNWLTNDIQETRFYRLQVP